MYTGLTHVTVFSINASPGLHTVYDMAVCFRLYMCHFFCLQQLFHVAYVLIKFANSPRPDLWVLERSIDFGKTYQPWKFFACEYIIHIRNAFLFLSTLLLSSKLAQKYSIGTFIPVVQARVGYL